MCSLKETRRSIILDNFKSILSKLDSRHLVALLNTVPAGISIATDVSCKEIIHNPTSAEFLRVKPWDCVSHSAPEPHHVKLLRKGKELLPHEMPIQRSAWYGEVIIEDELEFVWDDGVRKYSLWNSHPLLDHTGKIVGAVASFSDITDRKKIDELRRHNQEQLESLVKQRTKELLITTNKLEKEIHEKNIIERELLNTQNRLKFLLDHNPVVIFSSRVNEDFRASYVSENVILMTGYSPREYIENEGFFLERIHPDDLPHIYESIEGIHKKEKCDVEYRFQCKDGNYHWMRSSVKVIYDDNNQPLEFIGCWTDIHYRKTIELELQKMHHLAEIEAIYNSAPIGMCILDRNLRWVRLNERFAELNGVSVAEHIGKTPKEVVPNLGEQAEIAMRKIIETGEPLLNLEVSGITVSTIGLRRYWNENWVPLRDNIGNIVGVSITAEDITERKLAEERSEERFYKIFYNSPDMMAIIKNQDDIFVNVNQRFLDIMEYAMEEVLGHTTKAINLFADNQEYIEQLLKQLNKQGRIENVELRFRTKSGKIITVLASYEIIYFNGDNCRLTVIKDITREKKLEAEMTRLDRLNLIGEMSAGIAHEIRNPMTTVRGYLQMFGGKKEYERYREHFDLMIEELDRANSIITEFLSLAKNKVSNLEINNLKATLETVFDVNSS